MASNVVLLDLSPMRRNSNIADNLLGLDKERRKFWVSVESKCDHRGRQATFCWSSCQEFLINYGGCEFSGEFFAEEEENDKE